MKGTAKCLDIQKEASASISIDIDEDQSGMEQQLNV